MKEYKNNNLSIYFIYLLNAIYFIFPAFINLIRGKDPAWIYHIEMFGIVSLLCTLFIYIFNKKSLKSIPSHLFILSIILSVIVAFLVFAIVMIVIHK